jgi:hypothetical protein
MMELAQAIQFGRTINTNLGTGATNGLCVDGKLFSYIVGRQVIDSGGNSGQHQGYHGLVLDSSGGTCSPTTVPNALPNTSALAAGNRELLRDHMRLTALDVTSNGDLYTIRVRVVYGDDNTLQPTVTGSLTPAQWAAEKCDGKGGTQFCAVSDLTTTVQKRLQ